MTAFDTSGDGALQLDEFKTTDKFRLKLDSLVIKEQTMVKEAANKIKLAEIEANVFACHPPCILFCVFRRPATNMLFI